jgi:outer membrane protein OmpA-like peptidoglycan-associated protein
MFALAGLPLSLAACGGAAAPSKELLTARDAYANLSKSSAAQENPGAVREAREALAVAEEAHQDDAASERERSAAYVATRKTELAQAQADEAHARHDREQAELAYKAQLEQQLTASRQDVQSLQATSEKLKSERASWRKKGEDLVITLSGVSFETAGHDLSPDAEKRLDAVAQALKESPQRTVTIAGYTDNKGRAEANRELSQKRADAVRAYLQSKGVAAARLVSEGRGDSNPVASNATEAGRADNRRVELTLHAAGAPSERQLVKGTDPAPTENAKTEKAKTEKAKTEKAKTK